MPRPDIAPSFEIGRPLPDWHLESLDGTPVPAPAALADRPLLLLFFHLGCPGCRFRAIPFANRVVVERGDEVRVVGIHTTFEGTDRSDDEIRADLEALYVRFPVHRDAGLAATFHAYRAGGTPHWVLADRGGTVLDSIFGSDPNRALLRLDYRLQELADRMTVGFGGGCHWCTEAVFQALNGVDKVEQGWIRSEVPHEAESEAVLVHVRPDAIDLQTLIEVHLLTHASTAPHSMREKYRSAVYTFDAGQAAASRAALDALGKE
ncbi:MAG: peptide-methionine (S)-S-oxide reductase, partial [Bacteroidota bacterium]